MDESDMHASVDVVHTLTTLLTAYGVWTPDNNEVRLLNKLQGLVSNIKWSPKDVTGLFDALLKRFDSTANDRSNLLSWMMTLLYCIEINYITPSWRCRKGKTLVELVRDQTVTAETLQRCLADDTEKQLDEILEEIRQQKLNQIDEKLLDDVKDVVSSFDKGPTSNNDGSQLGALKRDLLKLCEAAEKTHYRPRLTQLVSWCIMALSETGLLIQVGTGEGKSCIVAMFAAFRAMRGEKVDIMSSSSVLAERDLDEWQSFYEALGITVDCNTYKTAEELKKCYKCQVVYGTVEKFAGDWLRHRFKRMDIFGQRKFQCAIVDEVDSLMLDKGNHTVYLSSVMPALQHLNPLLALIWATASRHSGAGTDETAVEAEINCALHFTPCERSRDEHSCYIPGFLSDLVKSKLKVWIENAFRAQTMTVDHEYVVERHGVVPVDYSCTGVVQNNMKWTDGLQQFLEMKHGRKLSDMTAITNYMSNVGLLQKYGTQLFGVSGTLGQQAETETLQKIYEGIRTCRIPSFKCRKLFEVGGVIVKDEKEWIEKICNVVTAETNPTPYRGQRAVLVICETISRAKVLHQALEDEVPNKKLYISNNMDNTAVFAKNLGAGDVIIATNLAGRGTDLQVSDTVKKAGGLYVLLTFLPKNARVEAQAFGRTARQGSPGSAQLIVCSSHLSKPLQLVILTREVLGAKTDKTDLTPLHQHCFVMQMRLYQKSQGGVQSKDMSSMLSCILSENSNSVIETVKTIRDDSVAKHLASYLECAIPEIKRKAELFSLYLDQLDEVYKSSNNESAKSKVSALNEFWGMWLLTDSNENDSIMDLKNKLTKDVETARKKLRAGESPSSNLHHYTEFGNELRKKGRLAESITMYTKAIEQDRCWAAFAYYNRAFTSLTQQDRHQDPNCIIQALEDLQNALKSVEFYCEQTAATDRFSKQASSNSTIRLDDHVIPRDTVLVSFKANINEAIDILDRTRHSGGYLKVKESPVDVLVPLMNLVQDSDLTRSLSVIRSGNPLRILQLISDPSFDILHELRSVECLGLSHVYTLDKVSLTGWFLSKIASTIRGFFKRRQTFNTGCFLSKIASTIRGFFKRRQTFNTGCFLSKIASTIRGFFKRRQTFNTGWFLSKIFGTKR